MTMRLLLIKHATRAFPGIANYCRIISAVLIVLYLYYVVMVRHAYRTRFKKLRTCRPQKAISPFKFPHLPSNDKKRKIKHEKQVMVKIDANSHKVKKYNFKKNSHKCFLE